MRRPLLLGLLASLVAGCRGADARPSAQVADLPPRTVPPGGGAFVLRTVRDGDVDYRYQVFVPRGHDQTRRWPVILFMHGSAEMGSDGVAQTRVGLGPTVRAQQATFPAVVVFPQGPRQEHGVGRAILARIAMQALDSATAEFHGDPARTYLVGYSLGAKMGYELVAAHPDRFAAFVPISGELCIECFTASQASPVDSTYRSVVGRIGALPMWLFNGAHDPYVQVANARRIVQLRQAMGAPVRFTEYPDAGHTIWAQALATPDLFSWLFAQHRRPS